VEKSDLQKKIREDEDFIKSPKFNNSINKYLAKNDKPLENGTIGKMLLISEEEVEEIYKESIAKLRKEMVDDEQGIRTEET
jgi:hypothetical protein